MSVSRRGAGRTGWWRLLIPLVAALLPLLVWPGLAAPFSTPKRWLLAAAVALLLPLAARQAVRRSAATGAPSDSGAGRVPYLFQAVIVASLASFAWSALAAPTLSFDALLLGIAGPLWGLLIVLAAVPDASLAAAHVAGATVMAVIALAQAAGADPFAWGGWLPGIEGASLRMRAYGTLGNPNFVAALIAITIPLGLGLAAARAASQRLRIASGLAVAVLAAALAATGSRAGAVGLASGGVVFALVLGQRWRRWIVVGAVLAAVVLIALSGGRGLTETLRGRVYIWQTAWAHAWEQPMTGVGPGAFELQYAEWDRVAQASDRSAAHDSVFAGPQQFAHNDYLQALVERGVPGLVTTVLLLATPIFLLRDSRSMADRASRAGAAGAVAACAALACFDFPLQRPAETAALWMSAALAWQSTQTASPIALHTGEMTR